jgi:hypothetical protein
LNFELRPVNVGRLTRSHLWILVAFTLPWLAWLLTLPEQPSPWLVTLSGLPLIGLISVLWARGAPWRGFVRERADVFALAFVLLVALGVQLADSHGVTTDGVIYFSHLRSVVFDRDLDVASEFAYLQQPPRPSHVVPVGPTFVWLPLYLAVAAVDAMGRGLGVWAPPADPAGVGLTLPYVRAALVSSFAVGACGLLVVHFRVRREFARGVAFAASLLLLLGTPLVWYMVYEPSMTHAASFGFVAVFVIAAERWAAAGITARQSLMLGALLGLAFMTRPQEAVFALFPATLLLAGSGPMGSRLRAAARLAGWAFLGTLPSLLLQTVHTSTLLRHEPFVLAGEGGYLHVLDSRWAGTLWSSWHGFFAWTPIAYIAFVAMFFYAARNRRWAVAAVLIVIVMAWVNGATSDWAGGWSFGGRRFTSVLVLLAPGLALLVHGLTRRPMVALGVGAACVIAWNQLLIAQYRSGSLTPGTAVTFGQIVRQQAALVTESPFFYPFAFPANAWFAWRNGLPIDRYDLLGPEPLVSTAEVSMSAASGKFLLEGWGARASDPFGELRWIDAGRADLVLPLNIARDRNAVIAIHARTRLLEPPQSATLAVLINGLEIGALTPDTREPTVATFAVPAGTLIRGFNRFSLERRSGTAPVGIYWIRIE